MVKLGNISSTVVLQWQPPEEILNVLKLERSGKVKWDSYKPLASDHE